MNPHYEALEFPAIIEALKNHAVSGEAIRALEELKPSMNETICRQRMAETTAAKKLLEGCGTPPLSTMEGLRDIIHQAEAGAMLSPGQLCTVARFGVECRRLAAYMKRGEAGGNAVALYGRNLTDLSSLAQEIDAGVTEEQVRSDASPALKDIRRKAEHVEKQIRDRLARILQSKKQYLAESFISLRGGRYVLPVKRQYQSQFGGTVIDVSSKGGTVFMEPSAVESLQGELNLLAMREDDEVRRILYTLSSRVADEAKPMERNMEVMALADALFARAKYSDAIGGREVEIGGRKRMCIVKGRHPLLDAQTCVPLDFDMGEDISGVIVTGPNTGGKTVMLKTVGLLSLMAQCGLHIPCGEGSYIAMRDGYWCDIGDSQSISQSLSTFSGHITNVIHILEGASRDSLVLLDELGSGTDPAEGMGIAIAVLEELKARGCLFVVTTHYPRVKTYAEQTRGVQSARMAFDRDKLMPLYRLEIGRSGESCALHIAGRLGMAKQLLDRAAHEVYGTPMVAPPPPTKAPASKLERIAAAPAIDPATLFVMGDSVQVTPGGEQGIVYRPADKSGYVVVQIKGVKCRVKYPRLKLLVAAAQLYPPDYDFSILFDTVENRKARHIMDRKNDLRVEIVHEQEDYPLYERVDWQRVGGR